MGKTKHLSLWGVLIVTGVLSVEATITPSDEGLYSLVLKKGGNATLPCPADQTPCHWLRDGHVVNVTDDCDQYAWEDAEESCNLRLLTGRAEVHEGTWQCVHSNLTSNLAPVRQGKAIYVTVREPSSLQVSISRRNGYMAATKDGRVAVTSGTQITANCSVSGLRPGDELLWTKEKSSENETLAAYYGWSRGYIPGTLNSQAISHPTIKIKDNHAKLVCTVMDCHGHSIFRKEVNLEVFYGPHYTLQRSSYLAHPTMQISMQCPLHSNPPATYRWSYLSRNGLWMEGHGETKRTLELRSVNYDQAGFYNCTATNSFFGQSKSASELIYLNVVKEETFRPQKVVCTLRGRVHEHVTLMCPTPGSDDTRWFFQGDDRRWLPIASTGPSLTLLNVNASQAGLYKCSAHEPKARDGCSFIYLSLGPARLFENLQNLLGVAFCAVGVMLFVGLLAFVVQISKIKAVLRVQERQSQLTQDQPAVWTSEKIGLPYYSLPPAYSEQAAAVPPNNTI